MNNISGQEMIDHEQSTLLHDILTKVSAFDGRLIVLEERSQQAQNLKKWMMGLVALFLIQIGSFAYAWGQFTHKLDSINLAQFDSQITTSLQVLADHGSEIQAVRNEQLRLRTVVDQIRTETAMKNHYTAEEGQRLERRMLRLEDRVFK